MEHIIEQIKELSEACIIVDIDAHANNQNSIIKAFNDTIDFVCERNNVTENVVFNAKTTLPSCTWFEDDINFYGYTNHVVVLINKQTYGFERILSHYDNVKDFTDHYACALVCRRSKLSKTDKEKINKTLTIIKNKELLLLVITNNIDGCKYHNYGMKMLFKL